MKKITITTLAVLSAIICGCTLQTADNITHHDDVEEIHGFVDESFYISLIDSDTDLIGELINQDNRMEIIGQRNIQPEHMTRAEIEDDHDYRKYSLQKVSDLTEFYNLENFKIAGYQLDSIVIFVDGYVFQFIPIESLNNDDFIMRSSSVVSISMPRLENTVGSPTAEELLRVWTNQAETQGYGYLTEDNMLYKEYHSSISTIMGDTVLYITVPDYLNTYEYLRDLAFQVIETAELVNVAEMRATMAQR